MVIAYLAALNSADRYWYARLSQIAKDSWQHEVLFEGTPKPETGQKYPVCVEGECACPPEDVGAVWGYAEFVEAINDPKHERHVEFLE